MAKILIPVTKAGKNMEVETDQVNQDLFEYCFKLGLKSLLNRGMTKVTKELISDEAERQGEAFIIASKNLEAIYANKIRMTGGVKAKAASGEVNTEAMRLARIIVKDELKAGGHKISHYAASEITTAAKELLQNDPSIVEEATANIAKRKEAKPKVAIDVSKIAVSAKKVAEAEAKKIADKAKREAVKAGKGTDTPISAKQAGKPAARPVPGKKQASKPVHA